MRAGLGLLSSKLQVFQGGLGILGYEVERGSMFSPRK